MQENESNEILEIVEEEDQEVQGERDDADFEVFEEIEEEEEVVDVKPGSKRKRESKPQENRRGSAADKRIKAEEPVPTVGSGRSAARKAQGAWGNLISTPRGSTKPSPPTPKTRNVSKK